MSTNSRALNDIEKDGHEMHIYLVGEQEILIKTVENFLNDLDHGVKSFTSVSNLLADVHEAPDLVLIDLSMPKKNALEAVKRVHEKHPEADIVAIDSVFPFEDAISSGIFSYINKPIRLGELELLLARVHERKKAKEK